MIRDRRKFFRVARTPKWCELQTYLIMDTNRKSYMGSPIGFDLGFMGSLIGFDIG